jgi:hypothetical protein
MRISILTIPHSFTVIIKTTEKLNKKTVVKALGYYFEIIEIVTKAANTFYYEVYSLNNLSLKDISTIFSPEVDAELVKKNLLRSISFKNTTYNF